MLASIPAPMTAVRTSASVTARIGVNVAWRAVLHAGDSCGTGHLWPDLHITIASQYRATAANIVAGTSPAAENNV
jgi:hypothetical protein